MKDDTVVTLRQPGGFTDTLTEGLRSGARQLLKADIAVRLTEQPFMAPLTV